MDTRYKHTKIVATLSPAVAGRDMITEFIRTGVNVFRLNFSHGSYDEYREMIATIKSVRTEMEANIAILQDLQGPRVRVAHRDEPLEIDKGDKVYITYQKYSYDFEEGVKTCALDHDLSSVLQAGEKILIEDGLIELFIHEVDPDEGYAVCEAQSQAQIKGRKGVNFPGSVGNFPVITEKDKADLKFGLGQDVDMIAMSFVRSGDDIRNLKSLIESHNPSQQEPLVFAKIEKPKAVNHIDDILNEVDGVMVARGDLGIEVPAERVPIIQKQIIEQSLLKGKRIIVATQMLDSMIRNPRPTRAEVSDVANAVIDHTDAVMLSGETSGGMYPLQAVEMMRRIVLTTEDSEYDDYLDEFFQVEGIKNVYRELAYGAQHLARESEADGIIIFDVEGLGIAEYMSEFRTEVPVFTITTNEEYYYRTAVTWGVTGVLISHSEAQEVDHMVPYIKSKYYKRHKDKEIYFVLVDIREKHKEKIQMCLA